MEIIFKKILNYKEKHNKDIFCRQSAEIGPSKTNEKNILFITKKIKWNNKRKLGYKTQIKTNTSSLSSFLIHFPPLSLSLSFNRILSLVLFLLFFLLYFYPVSIFSFIFSFSLLSLLFYLSSLTLFPSLHSLFLPFDKWA